MLTNFLIIYILFITSTISLASDHIDGPITKKHSAADLTDLFAFPTPNKKNSLTLIMNSYPLIPPSGHFEERLRYSFIIRQASLNKGVISASSEHIISCQFQRPHQPDNKAICQGQGKLKAEGKLNQINQGHHLKMWAGMRSDPFFFNGKWVLSIMYRGTLLPPQKRNIVDKGNVLSLVLEIDTKKLFSDKSNNEPFAIAATISVQNKNDESPQLLDRLGRPEITNISLVAHKKEKELRDQYNIEKTFSLIPDHKEQYRQRLSKNITYYDKLDGNIDWQEIEKKTLVDILLGDFLLIDMNQPCGPKNFLSIEKAILRGEPHRNCGGRFIHNDIIDDLLTLYVNNGKKTVSDGVDKPYRELSKEFPYLVEPDLSFLARLKAWLGRIIARLFNL